MRFPSVILNLRHLGSAVLICFSSTMLVASEIGTEWKWHNRFPWVYSDKDKSWQYWRAGSDGQFYHWKNSDRSWYRFEAESEKWVSVSAISTIQSGDSSSVENAEVTTGSLNLSLEHDGLNREYLLYVPSTYDGTRKFPLLFNFHGFGGTASSHSRVADMRSLADEEKFLLVYPQGSLIGGYSHWNAATQSLENKSNADDIGFVGKMISAISASHRVDDERIYACGYSNGAFFSYYLACYLSNKIAAVGSVSGTMLEESYEKGNPSRRVPSINLHGTADYVVPYSGGDGLTSISDVISFWVEKSGAESDPTKTILNFRSSTIEHSVYSDANGTSWVEHYKIFQGGHDWFDLDLNGSDTNRLIWDFFSEHDLNGPRPSP